MKPTQLLAHFDRISDAPDALPRLRRFILELAVRGKLVPQDSNETVGDSIPEIRPQFEGYDAPKNWRWTEFGVVAAISGGFAFKSGDYAPSGVFVLRVTNIEPSSVISKSDSVFLPKEKVSREIERFYLNTGDILLVMVGGSLGKIGVVTPDVLPALLNQNLWRITPANEEVDRHFLKLLIDFIVSFQREITHSTHGHLSREDFRKKSIPFPPLAEQQRIVVKVDELMALCDRLEAAQAERESRRDRLVAASLHSLNNGEDAGAFREHAPFYFNRLPRLTTRPEHIQRLRQTILNLAVRGKLASQDPSDEPASEMIKRIQTEKARLLKEGIIKSHDPLPTIVPDEEPFQIPASWEWRHFIEIAAIQSNLVNPRDYRESPLIAPDNIESSTGRLLPYETIGVSAVFSSKHLFHAGCILYSKIRPALAKVVIVDFDGLCSADMYPILPLLNREYLHRYMLSQIFVQQSINEDNRVAMPKINQAALSKILVAVPPLAEQHRIVAKVEEMLALCDRLEAQLATTKTESRRLLEAVLHEALTPALEKIA